MKIILGSMMVAALMVTTPCLAALPGTQLENVEKMTPPSGEYLNSLFAGYLQLSRTEYAEGDYKDADFFALRAKSAANNEKIDPQSVTARDLPIESLEEVVSARRKLIIALYFGAASKAPKDAAKAQTSFECWMQELEENIQPDDIAACKKTFNDTIDRVMALITPTKENVSPASTLPDQHTFQVYFGFDSSTLTDPAKAEVAEMAVLANIISDATVVVVGGADKTGSAEYNKALGQKRADAVAKELARHGIKASIVTSYGEQARKYLTSHETMDSRNRRVFVIITENQ